MKSLSLPAALCGRLFFCLLLVAARLQAAPLKAAVLDMDGVVAPNSGALWSLHGQAFLRTVAPAWAEGDLKHIKWKSLPEVHRWITQNRGATLGYEQYAR